MHAESVGSFILVDSLADFIFGCQTGDTDCISCSRIRTTLGACRGSGVLDYGILIHAAHCFRLPAGGGGRYPFGCIDVGVAPLVRRVPPDDQHCKGDAGGVLHSVGVGLD